MKCYLLAACGLFTVGHAFAADTTALDTDVKKSSYAIGVTSAQSIARQGVTLDIDAFVLGARDALEKNRPRLTQTEFDGALAAASQSVNERMAASAKTNLEGGRNYLAKNKQTQGVVERPSGLQYKEVHKGTGPHPKAGATVTVHYVGTFIDGTEFDSSRRRGEAATLPLDGVIQGWQEAIPLMSVGSVWEIAVPSSLAYGPKGSGPIGPNQTLLFEIELIAIKK